MNVTRNYADEQVIKSYTIEGISRGDMYKMTQVCKKVTKVIGNHLNKKAKKKEYLSDDDLYDIVAILEVLTEENKVNLVGSVFDEKKEALIKMHKQIMDDPGCDEED